MRPERAKLALLAACMVLAAGDSEVRGLATFVEDVEPGTKVK